MELIEQIKVVAVGREMARILKEKKVVLFEEWERVNADLLEQVTASLVVVMNAEDTLRELTLMAYDKDPSNKTPAVGVGIREVTKYDYDTAMALDWAIEHKMALKLDEAKFKNHVRADPPDFVTVTTEPQATIATSLDLVP